MASKTNKDGTPRARVAKRVARGGSPPQEKAGMPAGPAKKRSVETANLIAEGKRLIQEQEGELPEDATPLDVMLMAMRAAYKLGGSMYAAPYAEKAAPYLHAKISSIELKNPVDSTPGKQGKPTPLVLQFVRPGKRG